MAKIRRNDKREMPALNTSSLPDIIFMLLFFFMSVTSMKEVSYKVQFTTPQATELNNMVLRHVSNWTMHSQINQRSVTIS